MYQQITILRARKPHPPNREEWEMRGIEFMNERFTTANRSYRALSDEEGKRRMRVSQDIFYSIQNIA